MKVGQEFELACWSEAVWQRWEVGEHALLVMAGIAKLPGPEWPGTEWQGGTARMCIQMKIMLPAAGVCELWSHSVLSYCCLYRHRVWRGLARLRLPAVESLQLGGVQTLSVLQAGTVVSWHDPPVGTEAKPGCHGSLGCAPGPHFCV